MTELERQVANAILQAMLPDSWDRGNLTIVSKAAIDAVYNWQLANGYVIKAPFPPNMRKE
jgi:hypothetical protein